MVRIKAVIFDLDDTLISEHSYIESGYKHISKLLSNKLGQNAEEINQALTALFNESPKNVFNRLLDQLEVSYTKADIIELVNAYRNHPPEIAFFDDVRPCLDLLKEQGMKLGIITDGYAFGQRQKLKAVQADRFFDEVIVTDELGEDHMYWKPHSKAFQLIQEKLNVDCEEMVYIGDNPAKDFHISSELPIKTIRIFRNGVHTKKDYLNGIKEHHSIYSLGELATLLRHE